MSTVDVVSILWDRSSERDAIDPDVPRRWQYPPLYPINTREWIRDLSDKAGRVREELIVVTNSAPNQSQSYLHPPFEELRVLKVRLQDLMSSVNLRP